MKKFLKRCNCIGLFLAFLFVFTGCSHIEDTNGADNFSLQTITDQQIIDGMNTLQFGSIETKTHDETKLKINKLSGVIEIFITSLTHQSFTFSFRCFVTSGNFRAVIIKNNAIINDIDNNTVSTFTFEDETGKFTIKAAGESASFELSVTIKKS